jgi:ATP-dependent DNA helicase RecQ
VLRGEVPVSIARNAKVGRLSAAKDDTSKRDYTSKPDGTASVDDTLFERLRALRKRLADEHGLPPYVIFHDSTLRQMAGHRPLDLDQFAALPGVGQAKLARYGTRFIAEIRAHGDGT